MLSLSLQTGFERAVLAGVYSFLLASSEWTIYVIDPDRPEEEVPAGVKLDGVIGRFFGKNAETIDAMGVPTVITSTGVTGYPHIPRVVLDNALIGRGAAELFLSLGLKQFAYVGAPLPFAGERLHGFKNALAAAGASVAVYPNQDAESGWWEPQREQVGLREWFRNLPKPVGVFCTRDQVAFGVMQVCRQERIRVPDEVAVIGVDNDDLICGMCDPSLTSIISPSQEIGYRAAATIDAWLKGQPPVQQYVAVPHLGVAERVSTKVSHIHDPVVKEAIEFINEQLHNALPITGIATAMGVNRRTLERRFRASVGRSIHDEIVRARVERAKQMLLEGDLPLKMVGRRSGFLSPERFFIMFKDLTGETPASYRIKFRTSAAKG